MSLMPNKDSFFRSISCEHTSKALRRSINTATQNWLSLRAVVTKLITWRRFCSVDRLGKKPY